MKSTTAAGSSVDAPQTPLGSLIQRFIIYHLGLIPTELGESASLEELSEHILYYYDQALHKDRSCGDNANDRADPAMGTDASNLLDPSSSMKISTDHVTEEAIKFVGLCSALHSLPSSLHNAMAGHCSEDGKDGSTASSPVYPDTKEVHLSSSTLIFIPLKENAAGSAGAIAVAQMPRARRRTSPDSDLNTCTQDFSTSSGDGQLTGSILAGGDPHAVRSMVQQWHALFCLMKGGGVHHRLSSCDAAELDRYEIADVCDISGTSTPKTKEDEEDPPGSAAAVAVVQEDAAWRQRWSHSQDGGSLGTPDKTLDEQALLLLRNSSSRQAAQNTYPGMAQLYMYRKKLRQLKNRFATSRMDVGFYGGQESEQDGTNTIDLKEKADFIQGEIDILLRALPITTLRAGLAFHYDEMIADTTLKRATVGECVGRCIVELVPSPGFSPLHPPLCSQYPGCKPKPSIVASLSRITRSLLDASFESARPYSGIASLNAASPSASPQILAIIAFHHGRLLFSHATQSPGARNEDDVRSSPDEGRIKPLHVPDNSASLLHKYLSRYRWMANPTASDNGDGFAGRFIRPPPLSMLHLSEHVDDVFVPALGHLWMPRVHLPCPDGSNNLSTARVALFEVNEYDFLIFASDTAPNGVVDNGMHRDHLVEARDRNDLLAGTNRGPNSQSTKSPNNKIGISDALVLVSEQLGPSLLRLTSKTNSRAAAVPEENGVDDSTRNADASRSIDGVYLGEKGVDIVFLDRIENSLVLLTQYEEGSGSDLDGGAMGSSKKQMQKKRVLSMSGEKKRDSNASLTSDQHVAVDVASMQYEPLDCRHLLASHLPLDIILALDEMMKEIRRLSRPQRHLGAANNTEHDGATCMAETSRIIETCTFLPQGWVYGRYHGCRELYCIFDPNTYVTLADVQKAALRVRSELLNGVLL